MIKNILTYVCLWFSTLVLLGVITKATYYVFMLGWTWL